MTDIELRRTALSTIHALDNRFLFSIVAIIEEVREAAMKHPVMGQDLVHAAAVVAEESGELVRAALQYHCDQAPLEAAMLEAKQTAAMGLRFLLEFNN